MEGVKKINLFFEWVKRKIAKLIHEESAQEEYQGLRLPRSLHARFMQTFMVLFLLIFTSMFIVVGCRPSPTDAADYPILSINSINLESPVAPLEVIEHRLDPPTTIAGSYSQFTNKTLIIGHSTTVFQKLNQVHEGDTVTYGNQNYLVTKVETLAKNDVNMETILSATKRETIILMTCAGQLLANQDATHRLVITAIRW